MILELFLVQLFGKGDKAVPLALFYKSVLGGKLFTIKSEIKDAVIDTDGIICGHVPVFTLGLQILGGTPITNIYLRTSVVKSDRWQWTSLCAIAIFIPFEGLNSHS